MCFAPYISVSTFIVELLLAVYFFLLDSKDKLNRFIALLSLSLGIYQLNEFFICTTTTGLFTRSAFAVTAVLPAMAITYALIMWRKRLKWHLHAMIYLPAVFFVVAFSLPWSFKSAATCQSVLSSITCTRCSASFMVFTISLICLQLWCFSISQLPMQKARLKTDCSTSAF